MRALQPGDPGVEATQLWGRVTEQARLDHQLADEPEWPARRRAVRDLRSRLGDDLGIAALAATIAADEEEDRCNGAGFLTKQLEFKGELAHVVFWLIGVKSASGEAGSKSFQALQAAACDHAGVAAPQLSAEAAHRGAGWPAKPPPSPSISPRRAPERPPGADGFPSDLPRRLRLDEAAVMATSPSWRR